jgi:hypothetical protein
MSPFVLTSNQVPQLPGMTVYGWDSRQGGRLITDWRGRPIINLADEALKSLQTSVETIGYELHHVKEILSGAGNSESAAEAAGTVFWNLFKRRAR